MRITVTTAAVVASLLLWTASFYAAEMTYHAGQAYGFLPKLRVMADIGDG